MATIKDISRLAGVSHGTVSNVINKRGNVSSEKIRLVENAIRQLGYKTNMPAQRLRGTCTNSIAVILPDVRVDFYGTFFTELSGTLGGAGFETSLYLTGGSPKREKGCIEAAISGRPKCIVALSSLQNPASVYPADIPLIFLDLPIEQPKRENCTFVCFNYDQIANELAAFFAEKGFSNIGFICDMQNIPLDRSIAKALRRAAEGGAFELQVYSASQSLTQNEVLKIREQGKHFDVILCSNGIRAAIAAGFNRLSPGANALLLGFAAAQTMPQPHPPCYELDYRRAARCVFERISGRAQGNALLPPEGIRFRFGKLAHIQAPQELSFITLDNPTTSSIQALAPYFEQVSNIRLKIIALPHDELHSSLEASSGNYFDLIRMDMLWRSSFEQRLCLPLNNLLDNGRLYSTQNFSDEIFRAYNRKGATARTLPLDPTTQLLFYRKDLFEDATLSRLFYEQTRCKLEVPSDFACYNRVAAFFTQACNPNSPVPYGTTVTYGTASVAVCDFMPRFYSFGARVMDGEGHFSLNSTQAREALHSYVDSIQYAKKATNYWWRNALAGFADGSTAMTIVFINHASDIIRMKDSSVIDKIGTAPVPGNFPQLGGGCIGIAKNTKKPDLCVEFLNWVYSEEIANLITLLGGLSPCRAVYENEEIISLYPWLQNIYPHFERSRRYYPLASFKNLNDYRFERIIGGAVRQAAMSISSIDEALQSAQEECERIAFNR